MNSQSVPTGTSKCLLILNNSPIFDGIENDACIQLKNLSILISISSSALVLNLILNGTPDTTSYSSVNPNSIALIDTTASLISGGIQIYSTISTGITNLDLTDNNIILKSGDTLAFVGTSLSGDQTCNLAINWLENTF
jgi:hypothetical protein